MNQKSLNRSLWNKLLWLPLRIFCLAAFGACILIGSQDVLIFPGLWMSFGKGHPDDIAPEFVKTSDGESIEVWHLNGSAANPYRAIMMHGNGESIRSCYSGQRWFQSMGIGSYSYDYRGYGNSTGWPSEQGVYNDAAAVWNLMSTKEQVAPSNLIVFGVSIGTGVAAELASRLQPKVLVLIAPYSSLPAAVADQPLYRPLTGFLWYKLPTAEYVSHLKNTCVILVHGGNDVVIRPYHSKLVAEQVQNKNLLHEIVVPEAGHNDIFYLAQQAIADKIKLCLAGERM